MVALAEFLERMPSRRQYFASRQSGRAVLKHKDFNMFFVEQFLQLLKFVELRSICGVG